MAGRWSLPDSWRWVAAAEVADVVGGGTPTASDQSNFTATGGIAWLTPADLSKFRGTHIGRGARSLTRKGYEASGARLMPAGTVLFSSRAPIGYCVVATNEISTNQGFKSFVLRGDVSPEFVRHYLSSAKDYAESFASGTTFKELSGARAAELEVPLAPLNEQRRIVAKLDAIFEQTRTAKARLDRLPALLDKFKRSILAAAFRGDLTKDWRAAHPNVEPASILLDKIRAERRHRWEVAIRAQGQNPAKATYEEPRSVDADGLAKLPRGWVWTSIDELAVVIRGASPRPAGDPRFFGGEIPWITVRELTKDASMEIHAVSDFLTPEGKDAARWVDAATFLLSNSGATLGVPKVTRIAGCINDGVVALLNLSEPEKTFLYQFLTSQTHVLRALNQGAAQPNLNTGIVKRIAVPLPPEGERDALVVAVRRALEGLEALERRCPELIARLECLERVSLAKAFRGELVSQDPADEPASVLLERIRAARMTEPQRPRRGRGPTRHAVVGDRVAQVPTTARSNGRTTNGRHDESLDLVVAVLQQIAAPVTAIHVKEVTGLDAVAVKKVLTTLANGGQVRVHGRARGTTYEWNA